MTPSLFCAQILLCSSISRDFGQVSPLSLGPLHCLLRYNLENKVFKSCESIWKLLCGGQWLFYNTPNGV